MQVQRVLTRSTATEVLGAMSWAYRRVTGVVPPTFYSILLPTAQSALETSSWRAMWNWNAGNVTTADGVKDSWISLTDIASSTSGLKFKAYKDLGAGCEDMLRFLAKHNILQLATNGDIGAYVNGLAAAWYAGKPGAPGSADYGAYASTMMGLANQFKSTIPTPYGRNLSIAASLGIGAAVVTVIGAAVYYFAPDAIGGLLTAREAREDAEPNPVEVLEDDETGEDAYEDVGTYESRDTADGIAEGLAAASEPTEVQSLLFARPSWTGKRVRMWIERHKRFRLGKMVETKDYIRVRQVDPSKFDDESFRTIPFGSKGIKAIIGKRVSEAYAS